MQKLIEQLKEFGCDLRYDHFCWASDVRREGVNEAQEYVCRQVLNSIKECIQTSKNKADVINWMVGLFRALQDRIVRNRKGGYKEYEVAYKNMVQRMKPLLRDPEIFKQERIIRIIGYKDRG